MRRLAVLTAAFALGLAAPAAAAPQWAGIIEGAYGTPWSHAARMRILNWMPAHNFKQYIHAPKEDVYQRALWRSPYPAGQMRQFQDEIAAARRLHLQWIPNVSPGAAVLPTPLPPGEQPSAPLCFSCAEDAQAVADKFRPFLEAGVQTVMVSFDDVEQTFTRSEDTAAFGSDPTSYGSATGVFLDRVYDDLHAIRPGAQLLTVTADYAGTQDTPYLQGLRSTLRPAVQVMWTGTRVRSSQWTAADAQAYAALVGRTPIVWDNWTNNDFVTDPETDDSARLFLGPYMRSSSVARSVAGWFFNPASEADVNMLPLATAGAWLRNPWRYNARVQWLKAVNELAGNDPARAAALRAFAESSYSTRLNRTEGPTFVRLSRTFLGAFDGGAYWGNAVAALRRELWLARSAPRTLKGLGNRAFYQQITPFVDAAADSAAAGIVGTMLLEAERPSLSATRTARGGFSLQVAPPNPGPAELMRTLLGHWRDHLQSQRREVYGWRPADGVARPSYAPRNVLDAFLDEVERRDAAWQSNAETAASGVSVLVDGSPGPAPVNGTIGLSGSDCGALVVATDAAGGQASIRLPHCAR